MNASIRANCLKSINQILWRIGNCTFNYIPRCPPLDTDETCCLEPGTYDLEWEECLNIPLSPARFRKSEENEVFFIIQGEKYSKDDVDYSDTRKDVNRYSVEVIIKGISKFNTIDIYSIQIKSVFLNISRFD